MNRKQFLVRAIAASMATACASRLAFAQQGDGYRTLRTPVATDADPGKIEVIEFFWFSCPHCNVFEPFVEAWSSNLPADVAFRREHVPSREGKHQQLYYALQSINADKPRVMRAVFDAYHRDHIRLSNLKEMIPVVAAAGVDPKLFEAAFNSFGIDSKMKRAGKLAEQYGVEGVPAIGINGKYLTSPGEAGGNEAALRVTDALIARERKDLKS